MTEAGHLLDTNVISELGRRTPSPQVVAFVRSLRGRPIFISVLTLGELRKGAEMKRRTDERAAARIDGWIVEVESEYSDRTLGIDREVAEIWGRLSASRPRPTVDELLAATALVHELTLVTRNVGDVADTGAPVVNPWDGPQ